MSAAAPASPLLDPATLAAIRDLRLAARALVEGFLAGRNLSRHRAPGVEFSQFRAYGPGDDPHRIDWRLYARSDRLYLREAHAERGVAVRFVLDASASMTAPEDGTAGKFAAARLVTAALAHLADLHGDPVALAVVAGQDARSGREARPEVALGRGGAGGPAGAAGTAGTAAWSGARGSGAAGAAAAGVAERGLGGLLHALAGIAPGGAWPEPAELLPRVASRRDRELVVVLTDGWERGDELRRTVAALRALRHEVLLLRFLSPLEIELPAGGGTVFEDAESGARLAAGGGAALRAAYGARFAAHREALRRDLAGLGVALTEVRTDQALDVALRGFLLRRQRLP
jgi:uncharacterized protein (DUF58 family)